MNSISDWFRDIKIKSMSKEQIVAVAKYIKEYAAKHLEFKNFNDEKAKEFVRYIYSYSNLTMPQIILVDTVTKMRIIGKLLVSMEEVPLNLYEMETMTKEQLLELQGESDNIQEPFACDRGLDDLMEMGYYKWQVDNYFTEKGKQKAHKFIKYEKLFRESNFYYFIAFDKVAIISRPPIYIDNDSEGRLHSETRPAMKCRDGTEYYYLRNVMLGKEQWEQVLAHKIPDTLSPEDKEKLKEYV
jgi:hypothetical protein